MSSSSLLLRACRLQSPLSCQAQRWKHTVRIILTEDLPTGAAYKGDVIHVKAGYARNYLIPQKIALYAIPDNFLRLGRKDPDSESQEERRLRLEREASDELNEDLKASNLLSKYLKNKTVSIYRKVDDAGGVHPGVVVANNLRVQLSRQLKIDLDDTERIHILPEPLIQDFSDEEIDTMIQAIPSDVECTVQLKKLGFFIAKISLSGNYAVPLRFQVIKKSYTKS